jgi:LCP family protein required for cell wall assembly
MPPAAGHRPSLLRNPGARLGVRLLIAVVLTGVVTATAVSGAEQYVEREWDQVPTATIPAGVLAPEPEAPEEPVTFLLVGTDSRDFVETEQDAASFGDASVTTGLADAILIVRVDPDARSAFILSIPRDTWVTLPNGGEGRINEAFTDAQGGVGGLVQTITTTFGIPINHTLEIDFAGVRNIVDELGGVTLAFFTPMRDSFTGLLVEQTGNVHLDGEQALAFVRSRHAQFLIDGRWRSDPRSDLSRAERQQYFLRELARTAIDSGLDDPNRVGDLLNEAQDNLIISQDLDLDEAIGLLRVMRSVDPTDQERIETATLPVGDFVAPGGAQVLRWLPDDPATQAFLATLRGERNGSADVDPAAVALHVVDTTASPGLVDGVVAELTEDGFLPEVDTPRDVGDLLGDDAFPAPTETEIHYAPHRRFEAERVLDAMGGLGVLVRDEALKTELAGAQVLVVLRADAVDRFPANQGVPDTAATTG